MTYLEETKPSPQTKQQKKSQGFQNLTSKLIKNYPLDLNNNANPLVRSFSLLLCVV